MATAEVKTDYWADLARMLDQDAADIEAIFDGNLWYDASDVSVVSTGYKHVCFWQREAGGWVTLALGNVKGYRTR